MCRVNETSSTSTSTPNPDFVRFSEEARPLSDASHDPGTGSGLLGNFFGLDLRSLALCRVGLGLTLLADLGGRWPDLVAHYTDDGVLPRSITPVSAISIHGLDGSAPYQGFLFMLAAAIAVALLVGYRTQLA